MKKMHIDNLQYLIHYICSNLNNVKQFDTNCIILESNYPLVEVNIEIGFFEENGKIKVYIKDKSHTFQGAWEMKLIQIIPLKKISKFLQDLDITEIEQNYQRDFFANLKKYIQINEINNKFYSLVFYNIQELPRGAGNALGSLQIIQEILLIYDFLLIPKIIVKEMNKYRTMEAISSFQLINNSLHPFVNEDAIWSDFNYFLNGIQLNYEIPQYLKMIFYKIIQFPPIFYKKLIACLNELFLSKLIVESSKTVAFDYIVSSFEPILGDLKQEHIENQSMGSKQCKLYSGFKIFSNNRILNPLDNNYDTLENFVKDLYWIRNGIKHDGFDIKVGIGNLISYIKKYADNFLQRVIPSLFEIFGMAKQFFFDLLLHIPEGSSGNVGSYIERYFDSKIFNFPPQIKRDLNGKISVYGNYLLPNEAKGRICSLQDLDVQYSCYYLKKIEQFPDEQKKKEYQTPIGVFTSPN